MRTQRSSFKNSQINGYFRLTSKRAADLVFVFSNLCLREKLFNPDYKEEFVKWIDEDE
jgi:hypothetical protein